MVFCIGTGAHKRPLRYIDKIPGHIFFSIDTPTYFLPFLLFVVCIDGK